jgi:hypothetical protein
MRTHDPATPVVRPPARFRLPRLIGSELPIMTTVRAVQNV